MTKITFTVPSKDSPGFLRRVKRALELKEQYEQEPSVKLMDTMIEFLADYVSEPAERGARVEALLDATETQIVELLGALTGGGVNPTNPRKRKPTG